MGAWHVEFQDLLNMIYSIGYPILNNALIHGLLTEKYKRIDILGFVLFVMLVLAPVATSYLETAKPCKERI